MRRSNLRCYSGDCEPKKQAFGKKRLAIQVLIFSDRFYLSEKLKTYSFIKHVQDKNKIDFYFQYMYAD